MEKKTMTPSNMKPMTDGQIAKFTDVLKAKLRKAKFLSESAQIVLGDPAAISDIADATVRKFEWHIQAAEAKRIIVRTVSVNRTRSQQEVLDATGRGQYTDDDVVANMPRGEGKEAEVHFIPFEVLPDKYKEGNYISDNNLDCALDELGYKSADPYSLAAVNEADPAFADEYPNGTHWKDEDGNWCFAYFRRLDERNVYVNYIDFRWNDDGYFAAVPKSTKEK